MAVSIDQQIIKQYQPLIRALIPYEQQNKLLEGLNKFTGRVSGTVRKVIKEEVIRLTSLTDAPADNSAFAQFPVFKFSHYGVEMRLDKVGAQILQKESELYQDRYTVGVFETITSSDYYLEHLKKENHKKIVDAFTIESQSLEDICFGDDLAITPNFPVSSPEFEKGRNCTISSLSFRSMALESKRPPKVSSKDVFMFHFPEVPGLPKDMVANFVVSAIKFNKDTEKYETHFKLHTSTAPKVSEAIKKYINMASFKQPLQRELESERAMQDLERDRVLDNSPWVPLSLQLRGKSVTPLYTLFTQTNQQYTGGIAPARLLCRAKILPRVVTELSKLSEAFVLSGTIETRNGPVQIACTLRELERAGILASVVHLLNANQTLYCLQCRMERISKADKQKAFAIHDLVASDYEQLDDITHVLFYKNVSNSLTDLVLSQSQPMPALTDTFIDDGVDVAVQVLTDEDLNRRREPRYLIEKDGLVKTGLLKTTEIKVIDISASGMCIKMPDSLKSNERELRVSVPDLKLKAQKYEVVGVSRCKTVLRLKLPKNRSTVAAEITQLVNNNIAYFKTRDTALLQLNRYRFMWELAVRHHPSASILCINNRYLVNRLKTLYQGKTCADLYPFSKIETVVPVHGFFADRNASKPKSRLLTDMFSGATTEVNIVHCVRKSDNKLVFLPEQDYLYANIRAQVQNHVAEAKIELCVTKIEMVRCFSHTSAMTKKRIAQLSRVDKPMYERLSVMQSSYSHVLYLTSESVLQSMLLRAKLKPAKNKVRSIEAAVSA